MGLRLQFLLDLGKNWWGVSVSDSTFMVLSFPPTPVSGHSSLSSPPVELGGNIRLGFESFSSSTNSESESDFFWVSVRVGGVFRFLIPRLWFYHSLLNRCPGHSSLSSPPVELDGNICLGFESFSSSRNSESESDSDSVWILH